MTPLIAFYEPPTALGIAKSLFWVLLISSPVWIPISILAYLAGDFHGRKQQYSLRELCWLTLVAACVMSWWHDHDKLVGQADWSRLESVAANVKCDQAIDELRRLGYRVTFDEADVLNPKQRLHLQSLDDSENR